MSELDPTSALSQLASKSSEFKHLSCQSRLDIVNEILSCFQDKDWSNAGSWVRGEVTLLGYIPKSGELSNEAKTMGSVKRQTMALVVKGYMSTMKSSLEYQIAIEKGEKNPTKPLILEKVSKLNTDEGELSIHGPFGVPLIPGHTYELWTDPTATASGENNVPGTKDVDGVAVVLGAGNQSPLSIVDIFQCLFVHPRRPVLAKHHPLRPWLHEPYSIILEPLIKRGFVHMLCDGGIPLTKSLLSNKHVIHVHVTGALSTVNAIKKTLELSRPQLSKADVADMITSELGCSTPIVLSPGSYTDVEMQNAAKMIVFSKKFDAGCNCLCAQALVLPEKWGQKQKFKEILTKEFMSTPTDPCYYPGTYDRCNEMAKHYKESGKEMNSATFSAGNVHECPDMHPVLIECGTFGTEGYDGHAIIKEAFGPVMGVVELPGGDQAEDYLLKTVAPFLNDKSNIFGTLSCSLMTPDSLENKEEVQQRAIAALKYGSIGINTWTGVNYQAMLDGAVWCGHGREEKKQSGNGYIGNQFSIPNVEKTVVYTSLAKSTLFNKNKEPPAIVNDALFYFAVSKTNLEAFVNICILLLIRFLSIFLPIEKVLGRKCSYGAAL